jgi:ribosomal protein L40E
MKIYFSEFEIAEKPVCRDCYVQNSKKAIAT